MNLQINDEVFFATIADDDNSLTVATKSKGFLEFTGTHKQDCCEDVAFDFDEISRAQLDCLKGLFVTDLEVSPNTEGGVLVRFVTNSVDPIFVDEFVSYSILISCHNYQNGYYNDELEMEVHFQGERYSEGVIRHNKN